MTANCLAAVLPLLAIAQTTDLCTSTCSTTSDGACDDGGIGSDYSDCAYGTDCQDCGARPVLPPPPPWPPGRAPPPAPPLLPPGSCSELDSVFQSSFAVLLFLGIGLSVAACSLTATQPKKFVRFCLLALCSFGLATVVSLPAVGAAIRPAQCTAGMLIAVIDGLGAVSLGVAILGVGGALLVRRWTLLTFRKRIAAIEGDLPARLADGSLRLLRISWLLDQPSDWVLQRLQDLPEGALWSPADAARLLESKKVAALSYKWQGPFNSSKGGGDQPDGSRFHLGRVLAYYRDGSHAQERPALMSAAMVRTRDDPCLALTDAPRETRARRWDFCALPQHDPVSGAKRSEAENGVFKAGLAVMSNAYASPRVLVLQHRRIPPELAAELSAYGGKPPDERLDLIPYAGEHCRSGWCTSESACVLLMTANGGHAYELGVGKVPAEHGRLPSVSAMEALFRHESTRFIGKADREIVSQSYLELRRKLEEYDEEHVLRLVRTVDWLVSSSEACACVLRVLLWVVTPLLFVALAATGEIDAVVILTLTGLAAFAASILPSRVVQAHLAACLGYRSRDSLVHSFHCSLIRPPFREERATPLPQQQHDAPAAELLNVPECFLPRERKPHRSWVMSRVMSRRATTGTARVMPT